MKGNVIIMVIQSIYAIVNPLDPTWEEISDLSVVFARFRLLEVSTLDWAGAKLGKRWASDRNRAGGVLGQLQRTGRTWKLPPAVLIPDCEGSSNRQSEDQQANAVLI